MKQETNQELKLVGEKRKPGPKSSYRDEYAKQVMNLCRLGATDQDVANSFGVSNTTVTRWKQAHPEFMEALRRGKIQADANVANRLYQRATGYTHTDYKVFREKGESITVPYRRHYPPDVLACIFWLKNRRPDLWRDKVSAEISGPEDGPIQMQRAIHPTPEDEAFNRRIAAMREEIRREQNLE